MPLVPAVFLAVALVVAASLAVFFLWQRSQRKASFESKGLRDSEAEVAQVATDLYREFKFLLKKCFRGAAIDVLEAGKSPWI